MRDLCRSCRLCLNDDSFRIFDELSDLVWDDVLGLVHIGYCLKMQYVGSGTAMSVIT